MHVVVDDVAGCAVVYGVYYVVVACLLLGLSFFPFTFFFSLFSFSFSFSCFLFFFYSPSSSSPSRSGVRPPWPAN